MHGKGPPLTLPPALRRRAEGGPSPGRVGLSQLLRQDPRSWPLSAMVIAALALALLPLGVLALIAALENYRDLRRQEADVVQTRLEALQQSVSNNLRGDLGLLQRLLVRDGLPSAHSFACRELLTRAKRLDPRIASIARLQPTGMIDCVSEGGVRPSPALLRHVELLPPETAGRFQQALLREPDGRALYLLVRDNGVQSAGVALLARLPAATLRTLVDETLLRPGDALVLRLDGQALERWGHPPLTLPRPVPPDLEVRVEPLRLAEGSFHRGAAATVVGGLSLELFAERARITTAQALNIALPALMWLTALGAAWLAIEYIVVRPLDRMRRLVERYARGDRRTRMGGLDVPSQEMAGLAAAFDRMAREIAGHDAQMEEALVTQKKLTREVHHRVKNNLQIVSSLLSLQARDADHPEAAQAYALIKQRVNALSLVHRWLYSDEATRGVDLRALVQDLSANLEQGQEALGGSGVRVATSVEPVRVSQDTAVPLAFLITELISGAARAGAEPQVAARVEAHAHDGRGTLAVEAPCFAQEEGMRCFDEGARRIVMGLSRQLRSELRHDPGRARYAIDFPVLRAEAAAA